MFNYTETVETTEKFSGTRLTLENEHGKYVVHVSDDELTMNDLIDTVVKPVLLSAGYHSDLVDEFIHS
jgi:hypothetical protein